MRARRILVLLLCAALAISGLARAERPGRLFFTPDERRALEQAQLQPAPSATPKQAGIRFDGMLWRERQLVKLWVDQDTQQPDPPYHPELETAQLRIDARTGQEVRLSAGQHWSPANTTRQQGTIPLQRGDDGRVK
ncbi:hypothetical protein CEW87_02050 [Parazoarcus communis]|uniref:LPS export ABC transporter periplasmic protein LptC n=1 Tax=Parazoarcus communis TaxID=41977 RepID=A0A2U8GXN3_9RHOO|nr:hypothetical protein [Parazoarcus communis]AWI78238.1 hypothetical protein CEW87_02050 [Parazoarcus communis]